jgi:hypothetical protein
MAKKRRRDPLAGPRYNPLGTKKQSRDNEYTRGLKNRIFELEQEVAGNLIAVGHVQKQLHEVERQLAASAMTSPQKAALRIVCGMSFLDAYRTGITGLPGAIQELTRLLAEIDTVRVTSWRVAQVEGLTTAYVAKPDVAIKEG